jgi:hypothetical protein
MTDVLEKEISGKSVEIVLAGLRRHLAYPMHAVILYKQQTGDSLFNPANWRKIDLAEDPERWLACLWAGLHCQNAEKKWESPFTLEELGALIDFGNAAEISIVMAKALAAAMPRKKEPDPNAQPAPAPSAAPEVVTGPPEPTILEESLPEPEYDYRSRKKRF